MRESIIGATFDLMAFDVNGNYGRFDRHFTKVADYFGIDKAPSFRRQLRNITFHYLRTTGYIEVTSIGFATKWTTAPDTIVQIADSAYAVIGRTMTVRSLLNECDPLIVKVIPSEWRNENLPSDVELHPPLLTLNSNSEFANKLAKDKNLVLSNDYQTRIFAALPSAQQLVDTGTVSVSGAVFEADAAKIYSFKTDKWESYTLMRPDRAGLYKSEYKTGSPDYFVCHESNKNMLINRKIIERDWTLLCSLSILEMDLNLKYSRKDSSLHIPRLYKSLRLPTLLERCFRSGTMMQPNYLGEHVIYSGITEKNIWKLVAKFPFLKVKFDE